jgi:hypothetical protein
MQRVLAAGLLSLSMSALAGAVEFTLEEYFGYAWPADTLQRTVTVPEAGTMTPQDAVLYLDGRPVPSQLATVETYPDGSLRQADVWFRTDLPARGKRVCGLRKGDGSAVPAGDLRVAVSGNVLEVSNGRTALRLPAGTWQVPGDAATPEAAAVALVNQLGIPAAAGRLPGPLLGVRLPSGAWTGGASVTAPGRLAGYETTVLARGPVFVQVRVTYAFADAAYYSVDAVLRAEDPLVRLDERYAKAGAVAFDLGTGLQPARFATKADFRGNMQLTPIAYDKANRLPSFVGWDLYLPDRTAVLGLLSGSSADLLALISTDAAGWLPTPYEQMLSVTAEPGARLTAAGSLASGRRTWGFLAGTSGDFPDPAPDLYRFWTRRIAVSLEKVSNWILVWPDVEKIEFPHTYFSAADLPGIRARLRAEPAIQAYMEELRQSDGGYLGWSNRRGDAMNSRDDAIKDRFRQYEAKYKARGGIAQGMSYISAGYLYFGDRVYLEQMDDRSGAGDQTPREYLDFFLKCYLDGPGVLAGGGQMGNMNVSDQMLLRCVAFDLLLGSDALTSADKREMLSKLAFMVYVMHEPEWQPPVHLPDGSRPAGYGQGTPNQKHCAFSVRAMTACMLANHPEKKQWLEFAMAELRPHYQYTIHESGALLESPFYSSRDTMRYAPFWSAMVRAGVKDVAPDYEQWMNRPKRAFQYLANMLTPKEPRMGGKRVYHPMGRSSPGVIDPTFMIGADPWGLTDPQHGALMRWAWQEQGRPSPDVMGATGGRNVALTLTAFSQPLEPLQENPLRSRRFEGMGAVFRSHPESDYESNVLFRHDGFCWDLYAVNNGALYVYGKGAPLLPRFGGYWSHSYGGAWMMDMPFGNRIDFASGNNSCSGSLTEFAALGGLADWAVGVTDDRHWTRSILFCKDSDRDDPVYLLVRDDVNRPDSASSCNWWIMTRNVAPDGLTKAGVVPIQTSHESWVQNLGRNWRPGSASAADSRADVKGGGNEKAESPAAGINRLTGQVQHFPGMCGVDLDLFIATPTEPTITTDAASTGRFPYCVTPELVETQQLIRIEQPAGKGYLTLLVPRWPNSPQSEYRTLADGVGVAVKHAAGEDRLLIGGSRVDFQDDQVRFQGRAGFVRHGAGGQLRLLVSGGEITADGVTLTCPTASAALLCDGKRVQVQSSVADPSAVAVTLTGKFRGLPVTVSPP